MQMSEESEGGADDDLGGVDGDLGDVDGDPGGGDDDLDGVDGDLGGVDDDLVVWRSRLPQSVILGGFTVLRSARCTDPTHTQTP